MTNAPQTLRPDIWPKPKSGTSLDPQTERTISMILDKMSIPQLVGQTIQAEINAISQDDIKRYHIGAVLNAGGSFPNKDPNASANDWKTLFEQLQGDSLKIGSIPIPLLWGTDAVHGHNNLKGSTVFPHNIALGAANDPTLTKHIAQATAQALLGSGIRWTFAPAVSTPQDMRWGRTYEGFSSDTDLVQTHTRAFVEGLQKALAPNNEIAALSTLKHFIGDGGTQDGIDQGNAIISEDQLIATHALPYISGIEAGALAIMASFSRWNDQALHGHSYLLTTILKEHMGFKGFVVGDWNGHKYLPNCSADNAPQAINAGIDMYMVPHDWKNLHLNLQNQVRDGVVPLTRLKDAVRRILRAKLALANIQDGNDETSPSTQITSTEEHFQDDRLLAKEAVEKSLILLKNNASTLPLKKVQTILVAGKHANSIPDQSGGWSLTWQGTGTTNQDFPQGHSILEGIISICRLNGVEVIYSETGHFCDEDINRADHIVWVYGETPYAEMEGDLQNIQFCPEESDLLDRIQKHKSSGLKIISLFVSGRPLWTNPYLNISDAFIAAWLPGSQGGAVAACLFGKNINGGEFEFTGKLPFPWPNSPQATNVTSHQHLFPLGYGLTFASSDADIDTLCEQIPESLYASSQIDVFSGRGQNGSYLQYMDRASAVIIDQGTSFQTETLSVELADDTRQNDARRVIWQDSGRIMFRRAMPFNLKRRSNNADYNIVLRIQVNSGMENILIQTGNQDDAKARKLSSVLPSQSSQWQTLEAALSADTPISTFLTLTFSGPADITLSKCSLMIENQKQMAEQINPQ